MFILLWFCHYEWLLCVRECVGCCSRVREGRRGEEGVRIEEKRERRKVKENNGGAIGDKISCKAINEGATCSPCVGSSEVEGVRRDESRQTDCFYFYVYRNRLRREENQLTEHEREGVARVFKLEDLDKNTEDKRKHAHAHPHCRTLAQRVLNPGHNRNQSNRCSCQQRVQHSNDLCLQSKLVLESTRNKARATLLRRHRVRGVTDLVPHVSRDHHEDNDLFSYQW